MRIGFDISQTGSAKAGCGYFAENLIRSLAQIDVANEYILYATFGDVFWEPDKSTTIHINQPNFRRGPAQRSIEDMQQFWSTPLANLDTSLATRISYMLTTSSVRLADHTTLELYTPFTIWHLSIFPS